MARALRALAPLILLAGIALAIAAAVAITERKTFAERYLLDRIAARGIAPASLRVNTSTHAASRSRISRSVRPPRPISPSTQIDATWSVEGVQAGRLDSLRVSGVKLRGAMRNDALSLGALDALFGGEADRRATPPVLPSSRIEIADGTIEIETPQGIAKGTLGGSLHSGDDGAIEGDFKLRSTAPDCARSGGLSLSGSLDEPAVPRLAEAEAGLPIAGRVDARGRVTRQKGERVLDVTVALRDVELPQRAVRASGINGAIALRAPPLRTPKKQVVSLARVDVGVPLTDGLVEFSLRRDGSVAVALALLHFAGGELRAEDVVLDLAAKQTSVTLQARSLDLTELLAHVDLPGIEGTGFVEGDVPLVLSESAITVRDGLLRAAEGGGKIVYTAGREDARTRRSAPERSRPRRSMRSPTSTTRSSKRVSTASYRAR